MSSLVSKSVTHWRWIALCVLLIGSRTHAEIPSQEWNRGIYSNFRDSEFAMEGIWLLVAVSLACAVFFGMLVGVAIERATRIAFTTQRQQAESAGKHLEYDEVVSQSTWELITFQLVAWLATTPIIKFLVAVPFNISSSTTSSTTFSSAEEVVGNMPTPIAATESQKFHQVLPLPPILPSNQVPMHIAVIMDGNRRYGRRSDSGDPISGHWAGGQRLVDFVQWCKAEGIRVATFYAFSTENWKREQREVDALMAIFLRYTDTLRMEALKNNLRVRAVITEADKLPTDVRQGLAELEASTIHCTGFVVNLCISYGGRSEIVNVCRSACQDVMNGKTSFDSLNEAKLAKYFSISDHPDPELVLRTSGERRISNFLLWQVAYAEFFFIDRLWPELTRDDLRSVLREYGARKRRFGT